MGNLSINGGVAIDTILDQNGKIVLDVTDLAGVLSNYFTIGAAPASSSPALGVVGGDTNIHMVLNGKGSGGVVSNIGTATPAGGAFAFGMGASTIGIYFGSGVPTVSAAKGSLYLRSDGASTSTRLYVNTDGATTWTNVTTAA